MQICCIKRKRLHKKRVQLPGDWFGTPTWLPFHCFGTPIWPPWRHVKTLYITTSRMNFHLTTHYVVRPLISLGRLEIHNIFKAWLQCQNPFFELFRYVLVFWSNSDHLWLKKCLFLVLFFPFVPVPVLCCLHSDSRRRYCLHKSTAWKWQRKLQR